MLGAALGAARPASLDGERLTVAFPADAAFVKKKAEANTRARAAGACAASPARGDRSSTSCATAAQQAEPATLDEAELIERLRAEFAAEEVFEDEE